MIRRVRLDEPNLSKKGATLAQSQLWRDLGVHKTTVSKMLARLLEMGWVTRERLSFDRRRWVIGLTDLGLQKVFKAMRILFRGRVLLRVYEELFPTGPKEGHVVARIHRFVVMLRWIAYVFGDRSNGWFDYGEPKANLRIVRITEPRQLMWIRLEREWATEKRMAMLRGRDEQPGDQPDDDET
jgi:DNA-binding MarR family transcriptional regulator